MEKSKLFLIPTLVAAAAMLPNLALAELTIDPSTGLPNTTGWSTSNANTGTGQQSIAEDGDTIFTFNVQSDSGGNIGVSAGNGFDVGTNNLKLLTAGRSGGDVDNTRTVLVNGNFVGTGNVWFASGRWRVPENSATSPTGRLGTLGNIYVAGGQLWLNVAETHTNDFFLGNSATANNAAGTITGVMSNEANAYSGASLRINQNITLSGTTTVLAEGTRISLSAVTLTVDDLTGTGNLELGGYEAGGVLNLTGGSDYSGTISGLATPSSGSSNFHPVTTRVSHATVLQNATVDLTRGTLDIAASTTIKGISDFTSSGTNSAGSITLGGNTLTLTGNSNFAGTISGTGSLVKSSDVSSSSPTKLVLSGNNTYSGGTTISSGVVVAVHVNALGTGSVTISNGGELEVAVANVGLKNLTVGSGFQAGAETTVTFAAGTAVEHKNNNAMIKMSSSNLSEQTALITLSGMSQTVTISGSAFVLNITSASGSPITISESQQYVFKLISDNTSVSWNGGPAKQGWMNNYTSYGEYLGSFNALVGSETYIGAYYSGGMAVLGTVPEPSLFGVLAGTFALALAGTRRRRKKV